MVNSMMNYDLVIIGGGSAGIAAAKEASNQGIKSIIILEKEPVLGGILQQCIHNGFGLQTYKQELTGPEYAYRAIDEIKDLNIEIKLNTMVLNITNDLLVTYSNNVDGFKTLKAKAIITSTGCSERTRGNIAIPGDRPSGVMTAGTAQKFINIDGYMVGKKVFILGSGDIGLIMARRMTLEGAKVLGVAEIMPYSNGLNRNIVQCLQDYNIPLYLSHTVKQIIGKKRLEKIVICKVDDHFNYIENTEREIICDTLLLSVGLIPSNPLLENIGIILHPKTKGPVVNECYQTSNPAIFACGNSLHVHDIVDNVSLEGARAGFYAAQYLKGNLKEGESLNVINGQGIGYVMPSYLNLNNIDKVNIFFRVQTPHKSCEVLIKQEDEIIKTFKKPYLIPSEMEKISFDKNLIKDKANLVIEVIDND